MLTTILLIGICFSGSFARLKEKLNCEPSNCDRFIKFDINDPSDAFPDAERLAEMCPDLKAGLDCVTRQTEICTGQSVNALAASDNETLAAIGNILLGGESLFEDLCDTTTEFYRDYVQNVGCIREVILSPLTVSLCFLEAKGLYAGFSFDAEDNQEGECMVTAHVLACISGDILKECGESARATIVEIFKRTKILKHGICTAQQVADLKTTYIDYLELESEERSIFEKAFDLRRRK